MSEIKPQGKQALGRWEREYSQALEQEEDLTGVAELLMSHRQQVYAAHTDQLQFFLVLNAAHGVESWQKCTFQREEGEGMTDYTIRLEEEEEGYDDNEGAIGEGGIDC